MDRLHAALLLPAPPLAARLAAIDKQLAGAGKKGE